MRKPDKTVQPKKRAFIAAYIETASIRRGCEAAKISRDTYYRWMKDDPEFKDAFADAFDRAGDTLEEEAARRAHEGVIRPVLYQGVQVVIEGEPLFEHSYSDTLLIFMLKGRKPDRYRERLDHQVSGKGGEPLIPIAALDALIRDAPKD